MFSLDGESQQSITGENSWSTALFTVPPGQHTIMWRYSRGALAAGSDCGWVDSVHYFERPGPYTATNPQYLTPGCRPGEDAPPRTIEIWNAGSGTLEYTITAAAPFVTLSTNSGTSNGEVNTVTASYDTSGLLPGTYTGKIKILATVSLNRLVEIPVTLTVRPDYISLGEALDAPELTWDTEGAFNWMSVTDETHDGVDAAVGENIQPRLGESILKTTVEGPGTLSFWWKGELEVGCDWYAFYVDANFVRGPNFLSADWKRESVYLAPGTHELKWLYRCGQSFNGDTSLWLDEVSYARDMPLIDVDTTAITAYCQPGQDAPDDSFELWNAGYGRLDYQIASQESWLSFTPDRGDSTGEHDTIAVEFDTSGLTLGEYTGTILISSSAAGAGTPAPARSIPVTVHVGDRHEVTAGVLKDNTLYEHATNALSNGAGESVVFGLYNGLKRRGLIAFDLAGAVPTEGVISSARVELNVAAQTSARYSIDLYRVSKSWGEGSSNASGEELDGAAAASGDATWQYAKYGTDAWTSPGGDYSTNSSGSVSVWTTGVYTIDSTDRMVRDIEEWYADLKTNHGWAIVADERIATEPKRIASSEHLIASYRPKLHIVYYTQAPPTVGVPDVETMNIASAQAAIEAAGLVLGTVTRAYSTKPEDEVLAQSPLAGTMVLLGAEVNVTVSDGPTPVIVPDVVGLERSVAESTITAAGFTLSTPANEISTYDAEQVCRQDPAGGTLRQPGIPVLLTISLGAGQVEVPNVTGLPQATAQTRILDAWLTVGEVTQQHSVTVPAGRVIDQSPHGGDGLMTGSPVRLTVSTGPAATTVPDIRGLNEADAEAALAAAGLVLGNLTHAYSETIPEGHMISQKPEAGTVVYEDTAVNALKSLGVTSVTTPDVMGMAYKAAMVKAGEAGLPVGLVRHRYDDAVSAGTVVGQSPASDAVVPAGTMLDMFVSDGRDVLEWVNFANTGLETGSEFQPWNTLGEAVDVIPSGGTIKIVGSGGCPNTSEALHVTHCVRLVAVGGAVQIGVH